MKIRELNKSLTKAQRDWAEKFLPAKAKLTNAVRIDVDTVRITFLKDDKLDCLLIEA